MRFWPSMVAISGLGLIGVASLLVLLPGQMAMAPDLPTWVVILLLLGFPWAFVLVGCIGGAFAAPRVGLCSLTAAWASGGRPPLPSVRAVLAACALGLGLGIAVAAADALTRPLWLPEGVDAGLIFKPWRPFHLIVGLGQGAIAEEIVTRWGIMSFVVWALWRVLQPGEAAPSAALFWMGNLIAALLFAAGHLPAAAPLVPLTAGFVTRTLMLNMIAGAVFGLQFQRHNLEMAMFTHGGLHLGFAVYALAIAPAP